MPVWGTLIALAVDGVPVVGVVSSPALGKRWWAATGAGAWLSRARRRAPAGCTCPVSQTWSTPRSASRASRSGTSAGYLDRLIALTRRVWRDRAYGDMWSYMMLAEGLIDAVGEFDVKTYDLAALIPIVEEAGGRFTSVTGDAGPGNGSSLASNGLLHDALLRRARLTGWTQRFRPDDGFRAPEIVI